MTVQPAPDPALLAHLRDLYASANQSHVFAFYDTLSPADQAALLTQLASIDVHRVNRIYSTAVAADAAVTPSKENTNLFGGEQPNHKGEGANGNLVGSETVKGALPIKEEALPLPEEACATVLNNSFDEAQWRDAGLKAIADNQVAVLLMAGGQGTRLGSALPKGLYDIKLPSGQTLFEYQAKRIRKLERLAEEKAGKAKGSVNIRWYVMTSGPTRVETEKYFKAKGFFGLREEDVIFFEQGKSLWSYIYISPWQTRLTWHRRTPRPFQRRQASSFNT